MNKRNPWLIKGIDWRGLSPMIQMKTCGPRVNRLDQGHTLS